MRRYSFVTNEPMAMGEADRSFGDQPRLSPEPDSHWPPSILDLEPEICWCLPHGHKLPCGPCQRARPTTTRKESDHA